MLGSSIVTRIFLCHFNLFLTYGPNSPERSGQRVLFSPPRLPGQRLFKPALPTPRRPGNGWLLGPRPRKVSSAVTRAVPPPISSSHFLIILSERRNRRFELSSNQICGRTK